MTLGERRAQKYSQKQASSFSKLIDHPSPAENPETDSYDFYGEQLKGKFEEPSDMNVKNILSVSSDPPTIIKQKTCQIGTSDYFNN